jgi:hypothetical protein
MTGRPAKWRKFVDRNARGPEASERRTPNENLEPRTENLEP